MMCLYPSRCRRRYDRRTVSAVIRAERSLEELKTLAPALSISDVPVQCMMDMEVAQSSRIEVTEVTLESMLRAGIAAEMSGRLCGRRSTAGAPLTRCTVVRCCTDIRWTPY